MIMNAPTRFGWMYSSRWDPKETIPKWVKLKEEAEEIVQSEPIPETAYEEWGVSDLSRVGCNLYWYSGKRIPEYFYEIDYCEHSLEDWIEHARMKKDLRLIKEAEEKNLAKYGLEITIPHIGKIDAQYKRLKEKSTPVVQRFLSFNEEKKEDLCGRIFGGSKKEINSRACRRVLVERSKKEN